MYAFLKNKTSMLKELFLFDKVISRNILHTVILTTLSKFLFLLLFVFLIQTYSKEEIGLYAFLWAFSGMYIMFSLYGFKDYAVQFCSGNKKAFEKSYLTLLSLILLYSLIGLFIFLFIGVYFFNTVTLKLIIIMIIIGFFDSLILFLNVILEIHENFHFLHYFKISHDILIVLGAFYVIFMNFSFYYIFLIYLVIKLLRVIIMFLILKKEFYSCHKKIYFTKYIPFIKKSFFFFLYGLSGVLLYRFDILILSYHKLFSDIALYEAGYVIINGVSFFFIYFLNCFYPRFSRYFLEQKKDKLKIYFIKYLKLLFYIVVLIIAIFSLFGRKIIDILYPSSYIDSYIVFLFLLVSLFFSIISLYLTVYLMSIRKERWNSIFIMIGAGVNIILNLIYIPLYSIYAAAITTIIGYFVVIGLQFIYIKKNSL